MKDLVVLILAGGNSDRFWPLSDKNSLSFLGKPLVYFSLAQFRKFGLKDIVIVINKTNRLMFLNLKNYFSDLHITLLEQTDPRGMAGAIVSAKELIKGKKLLIVNSSDIYEDILFSSFISELKTNSEGIITGIKQDSYFPGGYLKISGNKVLEIIEKPSPDKIPSDTVSLVFDYFKNSDKLLSAISEVTSISDDVFEKAINILIKEGMGFKLLAYSGFWGYLKYPWHTLNIMSYFLNKISDQKIKKGFIHKSAVISGNVYIEEGARILENTKIVGPTYIGQGTIIGQNCLVRESMIGANCVVGYSSEIARSFIAENCWFHTNYIGDSVISENVSMGAGTVLANYKLDETTINSFISKQKLDTGKVKLGSVIGKNVRIGVNCSIMPGIKIGENSLVGASIILDKDLPSNKYCVFSGSNYITKDNLVNLSKKTRNEVRGALKF